MGLSKIVMEPHKIAGSPNKIPVGYEALRAARAALRHPGQVPREHHGAP